MSLRRMMVVLAALVLTGGLTVSLRADPAAQDAGVDAGTPEHLAQAGKNTSPGQAVRRIAAQPLVIRRGPAVYQAGPVPKSEFDPKPAAPGPADGGHGADDPGAVVNYGPVRIFPSVSVGFNLAPAVVAAPYPAYTTYPAYAAYPAPAPAYVYYGSYGAPVYYARPYCYAPAYYYSPPVYYTQPYYGSGLYINPFIGLRFGFGFGWGGHGHFGFGRR